MKKLMLTVCLVLGLLIAPMAMALQVQTTGGAGYGPYQTGSGGEFTFIPSDGLEWVLNAGYVDTVTKNVLGLSGTFQTFCVEHGEFVYPNTKFDVALSQNSIYTGKPLTLGAAWLYHQFQIGQLQGYDYGSRTTVQALQDAIWYFMGVGTHDLNNPFIVLGDANGALTPNQGQIPVAVINIWALGHLNEYDYRRQDMLVCVPEPGILILLGLAMSAIGIAAPFVRKI